MKRTITYLMLLIGTFCLASTNVQAQEHEIKQLVLNYQKLNQLKQILKNMYSGYKTLSNGYNTIKGISEGNFKMHQVFLDGLLEINPAVKKYKRIADIIDYQQQIIKNYKTAFNSFSKDPNFNQEEVKYLGSVYKNLFKESVKTLDELMMVITANKLRMSDDERIEAIDRIFIDMESKLIFLKQFNSSVEFLSLQRAKENAEVKRSKGIHEFK